MKEKERGGALGPPGPQPSRFCLQLLSIFLFFVRFCGFLKNSKFVVKLRPSVFKFYKNSSYEESHWDCLISEFLKIPLLDGLAYINKLLVTAPNRFQMWNSIYFNDKRGGIEISKFQKNRSCEIFEVSNFQKKTNIRTAEVFEISKIRKLRSFERSKL